MISEQIVKPLFRKEAAMFDGAFQPLHLLVILAIALLVFGPKKLPELGKGLGESIRGFKKAMNADDKPEDKKVDPKEKPDEVAR